MNKKDLKDKEHRDSRVAYYDTFIKAWVQNRLETDKQLITLSTLAIGLLVGIFGSPDLLIGLWFWLAACFSFLLCIIMKLCVLHRNTKYIEVELQRYSEENKKNPSQEILDDLKNEIDKKSEMLGYLSIVSSIAFLIGIASTAAVVLLDNKQHIPFIFDILLNLA